MNRTHRLLLLSIALSSILIGCSDEAKYKAMAEKYNALQAEKAKHKAMTAEEMTVHTDEALHHAMPMPAGLAAVAHNIDTNELGRRSGGNSFKSR
jgi:nitrite reductase (NO-forming)